MLVYGWLGLCIFMLELGLAFVYILCVNRTRLGYCRPIIDFNGFSFNFSASRFLKQISLDRLSYSIQMTIIERPLPGNMKWALLFPPDKKSWSQWLGYSHGHKVQLEGVISDNIYSQQTHHPLSWVKPWPSCTRLGRHNSHSHSTCQQFGQFQFLFHYIVYHLYIYISHSILFI